LSDLPEIPDVGGSAINPEATVKQFEEFCQIGGKGAIIFGHGFAEMGRHDLEERLVHISRRHKVA
jgi:acyl-CoA synthetase (NDP forming)